MKTKFFTLLIVGTLAFSGMALKAYAQRAWYCPNCWYVSGYGGPATHRETDTQFTDSTSVNPTQDLITDYRTGYGVGGALGAVFCRSWRLEVEAYFRNFNGKRVVLAQDSLTATTACCVDGCTVNALYNPSTHYRSFSFMANGFYDFCLCDTVSWYVGGGIGPTWVEYRVKPVGAAFTFDAKTSEVRFSYQLMTGIAYRFCNHASITVGYRFWGTTKDTDAGGTASPGFNLDTTPLPTISYKVSERRVPLVNSIELGLRYAF